MDGLIQIKIWSSNPSIKSNTTSSAQINKGNRKDCTDNLHSSFEETTCIGRKGLFVFEHHEHEQAFEPFVECICALKAYTT